MVAQIDAMAKKRAGGLSLVDLGYTRAGVDDGWQLCDSCAPPRRAPRSRPAHYCVQMLSLMLLHPVHG